jgi:peptidoglycan-associated lipoprotein
MVNRLIPPLLGVILGAALLLQGCAPMSSDTTSEGGPLISSGSSLEAMRRGESAAEGPLKNIYFDFDRYDLRSDFRVTLRANADWLKENSGTRLEIEGHSDERGTTEYNLALGAKRAQSAKDYLVTLGISAERISTVSYGKEVPVCRDKSERCWQKNRRDRFVVTRAGPVS